MKLDNTLVGIFTKIQKEVQDKFGIEYSIEELVSIVDVQIEATKLGFSKGITVHWERFCKFAFTNRLKRKNEVKKYINEVKENENLSLEEKESLIHAKLIESLEEKVTLKKKANTNRAGSTNNVFKAEDVLEHKQVNTPTTTLFTNLLRKKSK